MPLTEREMKALRSMMNEELQAQLRPFQDQVNKRFDEVAKQIDGLYKHDEIREQEYLFIKEQIRRLEASSSS